MVKEAGMMTPEEKAAKVLCKMHGHELGMDEPMGTILCSRCGLLFAEAFYQEPARGLTRKQPPPPKPAKLAGTPKSLHSNDLASLFSVS